MPSEDALSAVGTRDTRADMVRERRISGQLLLAALGIVYGDIGTSPLYASRQALGGTPHSIAVAQHALGCASLIFWTLIIAATVKYVTIVLRATDQGEGGIVTLTSLASNSLPSERWRNHTLIIGLVGIALFYGDCVLTPAISVLSALEGLQITTPLLEPYIVPIAIVILALLFIVQKSGTAMVTTLLVGIVAIFRWRWPVWMVIPLFGGFLLIDLAFFGASALKIVDGGWFPIAIGCLVFIIMRTWRQGRDTILARLAQENGTVEAFWQKMHCDSLPRVAGTAIYLTSRADAAPSALAVQVRHNRCLHRTVILLTVVTERIPRVSTSRQVMFEPLHQGLIRAKLRFGFSEVPDVPRALARLPDFPYVDDDTMTTYFTGREIPVASERADLAAWQEPIFLLLTKFSANAADYFCLPPKQCVELATKIEI